MRSLSLPLAAALTVCLCFSRPAATAQAAAPGARELFERSATVTITARVRDKWYFGSGALISADGDILTCYHVVEDATMLNVLISGLKTSSASVTVKAIYPSVDLALLHVNGLGSTLPFLRVARVMPDNLYSDRLRIYGYMNGAGRNLIRADALQPTPVPTSSIQPSDNGATPIFAAAADVQVISIQMLIYHGLSGGPVMFGDQLIGVISGAQNTGGSQSWAIPSTYLATAPHKDLGRDASLVSTWPRLSLMATDWRNMHQLALSGDSLMDDLHSFLSYTDKFTEARRRWAPAAQATIAAMGRERDILGRIPTRFMNLPLPNVPKDDPDFAPLWAEFLQAMADMTRNQALMNTAQADMDTNDHEATRMFGVLRQEMATYAARVPQTPANLALRNKVAAWQAKRDADFARVAIDPDPPRVSTNPVNTLTDLKAAQDAIVGPLSRQVATVDGRMGLRIAIDREVAVPVDDLLNMSPQ